MCSAVSYTHLTLPTYVLAKNSHLHEFLAEANDECWVLKNTSTEADAGITLIEDVGQFKKSMLLKVRRGPREKLQAILEGR